MSNASRWSNDKSKPVIVFAGLGLAALALFLFCIYRMYLYGFDRKENFAPGEGFPWINLFMGFFVALPCALGLFGLAVWCLLRGLRISRSYAVVYPAGFVLYDGWRFSIWRWADVAGVNMQNIDQREFVYFIQTNRLITKFYRLRNGKGDDYQFWSTQGPRAAQFGQQVEQETYALMMPAARAKLAAGESVEFAPFHLSAKGLTYKDQFTLWRETGPATIKQGRLQVGRVGTTGGTVALLLEKIDNSHVFLPLLDEYLGIQVGD